VRYEELRLEVGAETIAVPFHERLTVIAGVADPEREVLVGELLGALAGDRGGVCLRLVDDDGRRLEIVRPTEGESRVVEVDTGRDVTDELRGEGGRVDLLAAAGLTVRTATLRTRLSARDVAAASQSESMIAVLAGLDQNRLWRSADALRAANVALRDEASTAGTILEDAAVVEEIERRHFDVERTTLQQERVRERGLQAAGVCAVGAIASMLHNPLFSLPFLAVTVGITLANVLMRRKLARVREAEESALDAAGARSYLGFHVRRVEGLLSRGGTRERLSQAAELHRIAKREWTSLVGDVDVDWVFDRRARIEEAAAGDGRAREVEPSDLAHAIVSRLGDLRAGVGGHVLPLILDEPFAGADGSIKHWLLELIGTSAGNPQIIYLTEDEEVAAWARMEALTGELALIEPSAEPSVA
jgi:hypothetical protein